MSVTRRKLLLSVSACLSLSLSGCSKIQSVLANCGGRSVNTGTGNIDDPTSTPDWANWGKMKPILRADDYEQQGQIHNPIPIFYENEWYMYAIDGDSSGETVNTDLYKRISSGEWELHTDNVLEETEINDVCVVDGTIYAYGGQTGTTVYTGNSLTNLTEEGLVADEIGDPGCYYDPITEKFHLYYEQGDPPDTDYSGEKIGHSISSNGIDDWQHLDPVIDTQNTDFDVGDPRLITVGDTMHLFIDYNREEPLERIIHYYGSDFTEFQKSDVVITGSEMDDDIDDSAISHRYANRVGDGAPRYIEGTWRLFFEVGTDCGGEIWVAESTGPTTANDYEIVTERRYIPRT